MLPLILYIVLSSRNNSNMDPSNRYTLDKLLCQANDATSAPATNAPATLQASHTLPLNTLSPNKQHYASCSTITSSGSLATLNDTHAI
jgi:hypothetical protein